MLRAYYARLMNYKSCPIDEEIKEPLWRFRQDFLERSNIVSKLRERVELNKALFPDDDLTLILELTYRSSVFSRNFEESDISLVNFENANLNGAIFTDCFGLSSRP